MTYPEHINLPFNFSAIKDSFTFIYPEAEAETYGKNSCYKVILKSGNIIVEQNKDSYCLPFGTVPTELQPQTPPMTVAVWKGHPVQVYKLSKTATIPANYKEEAFNNSGDALSIEELTVAGIAKQISHWEEQSFFCSKCGSKTVPLQKTFGKKCTSCNAEHYPHIHPCAIILVQRGEEFLLTRKSEWAKGRYGLVAGFLEMGESLEECAIREVKEETGVDICNVRYLGSQNWPFPAQLMAGFVAEYAGGEIVVDLSELEDARWFNRNNLPNLPGKRSIARWILDHAP